jgi:PAS domain S-box-containing protein
MASVDLSFRLAQLLSEAETPSALLGGALELIGRECDWHYGNLWRTDYDDVQMSCVATWTAPGRLFANFEALSQARRFLHGEGLPGAIWKSGEPTWIPELQRNDFFPRFSIAALDGLTSGAAVPIIITKRVVGAMEFFTSARRPADALILRTMFAAATQLASYLERLRLEEGLTGVRAEFELLAERSVDAVVSIDETSTILFVNPAFTRIFGYELEEIRGCSLTQIIPARLRSMHEEGIRRYMQTGARNISWDGIMLPALHRSGLEFQVEIRFGEYRHAGRRLFSGYIRPVAPNRA